MFFCCLATAYLDYHIVSALSTTFFIFFSSFFKPLLPCSATRLILSFYFPLVNIFFDIFLTIFQMVFLPFIHERVCDWDSLSTDPFCNKNTLHFKGVRVWLVHCSFPDPSPAPYHGSTPAISYSPTRTTYQNFLNTFKTLKKHPIDVPNLSTLSFFFLHAQMILQLQSGVCPDRRCE